MNGKLLGFAASGIEVSSVSFFWIYIELAFI